MATFVWRQQRCEQQHRVATAVPEGWHPHQLRVKAGVPDPVTDAETAARVDNRFLALLADAPAGHDPAGG